MGWGGMGGGGGRGCSWENCTFHFPCHACAAESTEGRAARGARRGSQAALPPSQGSRQGGARGAKGAPAASHAVHSRSAASPGCASGVVGVGLGAADRCGENACKGRTLGRCVSARAVRVLCVRQARLRLKSQAPASPKKPRCVDGTRLRPAFFFDRFNDPRKRPTHGPWLLMNTGTVPSGMLHE